MSYVGLFCFNRTLGCLIMGSLIGDGVAPLFGKYYGKRRFGPFAGQSSTKSIEGSFGMFIGAIIGAWGMQVGQNEPERRGLSEATTLEGLAALVISPVQHKLTT